MSSNFEPTRRAFFRILLGAVATGTMLTSPALADIAKDMPPDKWTIALDKGRDLIKKNNNKISFENNYSICSYDNHIFQNSKYEVLQKWFELQNLTDEVFDYMDKNFYFDEKSEETISYIKNFYQKINGIGDISIFDDEQVACTMTENLFSNAMYIELVINHNLPIRTNPTKPLKEDYIDKRRYRHYYTLIKALNRYTLTEISERTLIPRWGWKDCDINV